MPTKPKSLCQRCRKAECDCRPAAEFSRKSAALRGYGWWWRNESKTGMADRFIAQNPLCAECERQGLVVAGYAVDHIAPHRGDDRLKKDWNNLQTLCQSCHATKTAKGG